MIKYELYDEYGEKVHSEKHPKNNFATIILEHEGAFYRPIVYDLNSEPATAKCVPVSVIRCGGKCSNEKVSASGDDN